MKTISLPIGLLLIAGLSGCGSEPEATKAQDKEMRAQFEKGVDPSKLTAEQKEKMKAFMGGVAPSAPGAPGSTPPRDGG